VRGLDLEGVTEAPKLRPEQETSAALELSDEFRGIRTESLEGRCGCRPYKTGEECQLFRRRSGGRAWAAVGRRCADAAASDCSRGGGLKPAASPRARASAEPGFTLEGMRAHAALSRNAAAPSARRFEGTKLTDEPGERERRGDFFAPRPLGPFTLRRVTRDALAAPESRAAGVRRLLRLGRGSAGRLGGGLVVAHQDAVGREERQQEDELC